MNLFLIIAGGTAGGILVVSLVLGVLGTVGGKTGRLGSFGRAVGDALCRAPLLDGLITLFTALPWAVGFVVDGWMGVLGAVVGQAGAVIIWIRVHEWVHRDAARGPRIVKENSRVVGRVRNDLALWVSALAVPAFWFLRLTEIVVYPLLVVLVRFPRYKQGEWVNVSRHKFEGLVGHDLIWCLYCDWMTGIWSLGSDMLRNIESFWCPIRFYDGKKCENCAIDFPDLDNGWTPADGSMADVAKVLRDKYAPGEGANTWFGHRARLTIEGEEATAPKSGSDRTSDPETP